MEHCGTEWKLAAPGGGGRGSMEHGAGGGGRLLAPSLLSPAPCVGSLSSTNGSVGRLRLRKATSSELLGLLVVAK